MMMPTSQIFCISLFPQKVPVSLFSSSPGHAKALTFWQSLAHFQPLSKTKLSLSLVTGTLPPGAQLHSLWLKGTAALQVPEDQESHLPFS